MINNKGISIVEIIISITLIAIVMVFLFSMLITVRSESDKAKATANLLINQALLVREIENDFIEYELVGITSCDDNASGVGSYDRVRFQVPSSANLYSQTAANPKGNCLEFHYNQTKMTENGFLMHYEYSYTTSTKIIVVAYKLGDKKIVREVPILNSGTTGRGVVTKSCTNSPFYCAFKINLPIYSEDGEDYGIYLSYASNNSSIWTYNTNNYSAANRTGFTAGTDNVYRFDRINCTATPTNSNC